MAEVSITPVESVFKVDFLKIGGAVFRVVSETAVEPVVAVEKFIQENPSLDKLVTGTEADQLHFGLEYLRVVDFQPKSEQQDVVDRFRSLGLLSIIQGVSLVESRETLKVDSAETSAENARFISEANTLFNVTIS